MIFGAEDYTIRGLNGMPYSLEGAEEELERLQHKIDTRQAELGKRHDRVTERHNRRILDRLEAESDHLFAKLHPAYLDGQGYVSADFNPGWIIPCRAGNCDNQLTRKLAHSTLGFCPPCWRQASGKDVQ